MKRWMDGLREYVPRYSRDGELTDVMERTLFRDPESGTSGVITA